MADDPLDDTTTLLSDQPTVELIIRARSGDSKAIDAILQRCLPSLKRWAHGRLPAAARGHLDTGDLVQDAAMNAIAKLDTFEPRHVGAMQACLRQTVINRIRDEVRRVKDLRPLDRSRP
jgi:RNA polymerase sigma-70 factor, ECF subfamily